MRLQYPPSDERDRLGDYVDWPWQMEDDDVEQVAVRSFALEQDGSPFHTFVHPNISNIQAIAESHKKASNPTNETSNPTLSAPTTPAPAPETGT